LRRGPQLIKSFPKAVIYLFDRFDDRSLEMIIQVIARVCDADFPNLQGMLLAAVGTKDICTQ
jgi:hypothetical protein